MPIEVHVLTEADFDAWVASKKLASAPAIVPTAAPEPAPAAPAASGGAPNKTR
jgi:cytochrome c oxidase subunit II